MLKFSPQNAKTKKLITKQFAQKWLKSNKKVYSLDLLSGHSCPFALACKSKAIMTKNGLRIKDGHNCKFRCFSASSEVLYPPLYKLRKHNFNLLRRCKTKKEMSRNILQAVPDNAGIIRIHVGGDFFNLRYFEAWSETARNKPDVLFYAYTKALGYWLKHKNNIPENLVLSASRGGIFDKMIDKFGFRDTIVVWKKKDAKEQGVPIDYSDAIAANPAKRHIPFALLLHGIQPKGSIGAKLVRLRKVS